MSQVAIIIPAMRAHRLPDVVRSIQESTEDYHIVVVATGDCAEAARSLPVTLIDDGGGTWPTRQNLGYRATTDERFIFTAADDLCFRPGWIEAVERTMNTLPDASGVVAVNDLYNMNGCHFVLTRDYIERFGGPPDQIGVICHEGYRHSHVDDEIRAVAKSRGRWAFCHDGVVEHLHCGNGKSPSDETYRIGEASMPAGADLFRSRAHLWQGQ